MRFFRAGLGFLLLLGLLPAGCQPKENLGGKDPARSYKKVISLSPSTSELIGNYALDPTILKGRTQACNYPPALLNVPVVCSVKPDYEAVARANPDLIVYDATLFNPADIEKLKQAAPNADLLEFKANSVDEYIDSVFRLGAAVESSSRFSEYVDKVYTKSRIGMSETLDPKPKMAVLLAEGGEYMVAGTKSFWGDVITKSGGEAIGPDSSKFETMPIEALVQGNPDIIIVADDGSRVQADPRLKTVSAIRGKSIEAIPGDVLLRAGMRVDKLIEKFNALATSRSDAMKGGG